MSRILFKKHVSLAFRKELQEQKGEEMTTPIEAVRIEIGDDAGPGLHILSDQTIDYYLSKNGNSIARASMDAARAILFRLAQQGNEQVDILQLQNSRVASEYRQALQLYLRDPNLNPIMNSLKGYFGNTSKEDIFSNNSDLNNNIVKDPSKEYSNYKPNLFSY